MTAPTGAPETELRCPSYVPERGYGDLVEDIGDGGFWVYLHSFPAGWIFVSYHEIGRAGSWHPAARAARNIAIGKRCGSYPL